MQSQPVEDGACESAAEEVGHLEAHLRSRLNGRIRDVHLVFREGGVILRGHAHTYYAKQIAQHLVMELTKRSILANEIEVS